MQVIGLCRFSYPAIGGFQVAHDTIEDRIAFLHDPARLDARFAVFEAFTLPCLRAQTDPDFTFLIVVGDTMPDAYLERLEALVADIPQAVIQPHPPGPHREVMRTAINTQRVDSDQPCLQFRLDDDDAVAVGFVETLRDRAHRLTGLLDDNRTITIDFNQGHIATPCADGILAKSTQAAYWSPALALMVAPGADITVMNFSHHRIWKTMPTVTFTGTDMMLRGHTGLNDSRQKPGAKPARLSLLGPRGEKLFRRTYNIDADHVRALFSAPQ